MQPGDTFLGIDLAAGGHLTHGSPVNMSGKWFKAVPYGVRREDQRIDMDEVAKLAQRARAEADHRRRLRLSAHIDFARFREIADEVGAYLMVDMAHIAGLVAGGAHPRPVPHAHVVTSTTHKTLRGPRGGMILTNDEDIAKKINSAVFPGLQGGPLMHVIAAKAVAFGEALRPTSSSTPATWSTNAKALAEMLKSKRPRHRLGRHRQPPDAGRSAAEAADRQGRRAALGRAHITCNKNGIPFDPGKADRDLGRASRHAGRHHARLRRRRIPRDRRPDRRGARRAVAEGRRRGCAGRGRRCATR